jgi:hypothetical protein
MIFINSNWFNIRCSDVDVIRFVNATGITDVTIIAALCKLTTSLKNNGIWDKTSAIYPFVGGTAANHKFNLKNPLDTNAAFRLTFVGGWTHSANGALPNGTNAYANTFFNSSTNGLLNSQHLTYYSRSNTNSSLASAEIELGAGGAVNTFGVVLEIRTSNISYVRINSGTFISAADTDSRAFYLGNRTDSNAINLWRNSTKIATGSVLSTFLFNQNYYLGAFNNNGTAQNYSRKQCAFASIGTGLTDAEAVLFYNIVQEFQTTLGRNV